MNRLWQICWIVVLPSAVSLLVAGNAAAAVQIRAFVGSLTAAGCSLCEKGGLVCLRESGPTLPAKDQDDGYALNKWRISAPTIKDKRGKLLAVDPTGETDSVRMIQKGGDHSKWTFEIQSTIKPKQVSVGYREGNSGYRLRIRVAKGKYEGWYIAAEDGPDTDNPHSKEQALLHRLKLVQNADSALLFTYIEEQFKDPTNKK